MPVADLLRVSYDYALIRVVPRVERGECLNVGVLLSCEQPAVLWLRHWVDAERLRALDPDLDPAWVCTHLDAMARICAGASDAGPIAALPHRARFHWLTAPRSSLLQPSPVHSGFSRDLAATAEHLLECMVRVRGAGR